MCPTKLKSEMYFISDTCKRRRFISITKLCSHLKNLQAGSAQHKCSELICINGNGAGGGSPEWRSLRCGVMVIPVKAVYIHRWCGPSHHSRFPLRLNMKCMSLPQSILLSYLSERSLAETMPMYVTNKRLIDGQQHLWFCYIIPPSSSQVS